MCRVQADITWGDISGMFMEFLQSYDPSDGIMPGGTGEANQEREVYLVFLVVYRKSIKCMAKIEFFQIRIPAPVCIWVRIMPGAGGIRGTFAAASTVGGAGLLPIRIGMGMDTGAIPGYGQVVFGDQAELQGWPNRSDQEKIL